MRIFLPLLLILSLSSGACVRPPTQSATSSPIHTSTVTQTARITPMVTETLSSLTSTPGTRLITTPTFEPSSTPAGFYHNDSAGFAFVRPESWQLLEEDGTRVYFYDESAGIGFIVSGELSEEKSSANEIAQDLILEFDVIHPSTKALPSILIGGSFQAEQVELTFTTNSRKVTWRIAYLFLKNISYTFMVFGSLDDLDGRQRTLYRVFSSIQLFQPKPFGLPRDETLYLLGWIPKPEELDPAVTTGSAQDFVGLLFSGLVRLMPDLKIDGDLAQDWTISPDGLIYTFHLRPELKFASGEPLTAQAVKDSWERAAEPETGSFTAATYLGDIRGVKEKLAGKASSIDGVTVIDATTLQVELDTPKPYFLAKLTVPTSFVIDPEGVKRRPKNWMYEDNSSGPYVIKEIEPGEAILFERNENYWNPAPINYLVFNAAPGGSPISLYQAGSVDILSISSDQVIQVRQVNDPLNAEWLTTPSLCTDYLQFDNQKVPMDDRNVRLAFALATDKAALLERLTQGIDRIAETLLPPAMPGYSPDHPVYAYDPATAKAALMDSNYAPNLPEITLTTAGSINSPRDDVTALLEMWKQALGITVNVEYIDWENFTRDARQQHGQILLGSWCADYPDPQNFLDILFQSNSEFNTAGYQDQQVDEMLAQAALTLDPADRLKLYQHIEDRLLSEVAVIPLDHPVFNVLVKPRIQNFILSPLYSAYIQWLSLEPEE